MSAPSTDCVKVAVRVRPFISSELNRGCIQIVQKTPGQPQLTITGETTSKIQDYYTFNDVYMADSNQEEVYNTSVKPIIKKLFEGYNVTILAYGQTGSGKTFTMGTTFEGEWDNPDTGIIPRSLKDIFATIREIEQKASVAVTCSFMELYQENLYDLLSGKLKDQSICDIREDPSKGIIINGLSEQPVNDVGKAARYLIEGGENRTVGATAMNDVSSRSHAIFTINVKIAGFDGSSTKSKFHLVDLAGSERSKKTKATGKRFKEGVKINQGLLALGNVISALGGGSGATGGYISYRDSKLTRLLQNSLGGNSVTLMIACVSPADYNIEETLSTLRYADRAKKIKNKPIKNQDSKEFEIQRLNNVIHDLRMKLLQQNPDGSNATSSGNTAAVCGVECKKTKQTLSDETNTLRQQLSNFLTVINGLNARHLMDETFYNELIERYETLRDLLLKTCQAEFAIPDTKIFEQIQEITKGIETLIGEFRNESNDANIEDDYKTDDNSLHDAVSTQKRLEYTTAQIKSLKQIKELEHDLKIKQALLKRKNTTTPYLTEEADKTFVEYQTRIADLVKELDDLRGSTASNVRQDKNVSKVNMDRKHKIEKLEKDLEEMRKKCNNLEKTKKLAEQDRKRIEDLKKEIQAMKTARVQLIRQQRVDADRYKKWINSRDKEINTLKEKGKKVQNEMKRMERMHEKQQAVLKRKVEEAKAVNKRLQDVMDCSKRAKSMRQSAKAEKADVVQSYIDHELMVLMSTVDAKIAMQSLMNDRGLLSERLMNLKSTVNKNEALEEEIKQLEEDLEMRNTQIADIRQKVMQTDLDAMLKSIPDNFNSVAELKVAMGLALQAVMDLREDFTSTKTKAEDLKIAYETSEERIEQMTEEMSKEREQHEMLMINQENEFAQQLAYMCELNSALPSTAEVEDIRAPVYVQMSNQLCSVRQENKNLKMKNSDLEIEIMHLQEELNSRRGKKAKKNNTFTKVDNNTFNLETEEDDDEEIFDFNDSFRDPDWQKTPIAKRSSKRTTSIMKESVVNRMNGTGILANISETSDTSGSIKRSFNGQTKCSCKGSCATKQCGCKKNGNYCTDSCKCSDACVNFDDDSHDSDETKPEQDVANVENIELAKGSPETKLNKADFSNITTPYYPYLAKKRKPLLQI